MAKPFQLEILTPERAFYRGECISVIVPVSDGMLGIMANHTPMTAAITDGEVVFTLPDGSKIPCAVTQGMIDVSAARVRVLCDSALHPDEINAEAERKQAEAAALKLREKLGHRDYVLSKLTFAICASSSIIPDNASQTNLPCRLQISVSARAF